jgi:hypothetical protein
MILLPKGGSNRASVPCQARYAPAELVGLDPTEPTAASQRRR